MTTNIRTIERDELARRIASSTPPALFEVLPARYWASGHLPSARAMPPDLVAELAAQHLPDKDAEVVLYCSNRSCGNSHAAAARLVALGYTNVRVYAGGKADWAEAGLSLEEVGS